ncbi:trimethyllysine dioxygenase TmlH [Aspergillus campestris IBT 28561]|uniref:Trimethyllysine dioxygenase TmlH n=1 Tax=Aspergillus campestris (strain IBT 28561) TaxID=1392248 RepID=A0A2I1D2S5_ASPC2|nr:trimethyllysine dioxygenase TmlH [Aspergillus campestris IBT 28561]PKY04174.1 trimethyllysine dioxygenase TmlH [Aspergillus campestris IBT 28561]
MSGPGVGHEFPPQEVSWQKRDVLLFANSIGCKADELHFLYELHPNFAVFPTYPLIIPFKLTDQEVTDFYARSKSSPIPGVPQFDSRRAVDGQRKLTVLKPLPPTSAGKKFELRSRVIGVYDKGKSGSVIETEQSIVDTQSGEVYSKTVSNGFFVGQGNWGGPKGPSAVSYAPPQGKNPDAVHVVQTTNETAHLYRLNGDYNPLHATPEPGQQMGFGGVIIHGLFSWNTAAQGILRELGGSDPKNLREFQARFASPVKPGDKLTTEIWRMGTREGDFEEVRFVTKNDKGTRCLSTSRRPVLSVPRQLVSCPHTAVFEGKRTNSTASTSKEDKLEPEDRLRELIEGSKKPSQTPGSVDSKNGISLRINNAGRFGLFGKTFLRENCRCPECTHPDTMQRIVDTFKIPKNLKAEKVDYDKDGVIVQWSDGHRATYPFSFLNVYSLQPGAKKYQWPGLDLRPVPTHSPYDQAYPTVLFSRVMEDDQGLLEWLDNIYEWGFCFVKGVPTTPEATEELLKRIAYIRPTHYGGFWDFTADLTFKDTAYTTEFLGAHTDNTYFTDPARLQLFHLLSHTDGDGGESLLVDGFRAAETLREENTTNYFALGSTTQPAHSSGNPDVCIQPAQEFPVLNYHRGLNRLYQIRWNNYDRAPKMDWSLKQQTEWYRAAGHWDSIIKRKDMEIWTQLEPGTALIFDNWRMLHGRSQFTGKRRMCGGYINNDDFISKYRLLKFGRERVLKNLGNYRRSPMNPSYYL